ncbi:Ycf66 family protein [Vacuolonema iberomarrocanum]|uniref:Ycf66 family protein n=1 Tax=Vacuolonema iberomarrocanum TaxID=3454632 RepID=UPI0019E1B7CF|nr:Ycf66 family protein [filamentous cyanobacterium LEGE 07170]
MVEVGLIGSQLSTGLWTQPVLAQVNFGGNPAALLGIALAVGGAGLYFLRSVRPQVARDYDIALAAVALLAGAILFFQGWRLDPILTFGSYLLAGAAGFFAFETIKLRGATAEQAKRYTPLVDDERPVSRVYQAELDDEDIMRERPNPATRRIRGTRDYRSSDYDDYGDDRRPAIRGASDRSPTERSSSPSRRRPSSSRRPSSRPSSRPARSDWDDEPQAPNRYDASFWEDDDMGDRGSTYSSSGRSSSRPRRPRPPIDDPSPRRSGSSTDYVDYETVDYGDSEYDNSSNFDD